MLLKNSITEDKTIWAGLNHPELPLEEADIAVFGIPYDGGVSFRSGTCEAPQELRKITHTISPTTEDFRDISSVKVKDLGDCVGKDRDEMFAEAEAKYKDEIKAEADQVRAAGGLFILGTERHESRRIDNQLRGRAGRQGDPGESRFYLSLEDDIMRLFGSERVMGMMEKLGVDEDTPIDAKILSNAIENAQKQVESRNFQTRKTVLEYDDVMNTQRKVIYEQRRKVLDGENLKESVQAMLSTVISNEVNAHMGELKHMDAENWREVCAQFRGLFLRPDEFKFTDEELQQYDAQALTDLLQERASDIYARKEAELGEPLMRELERVMMLRVVDEYWMDNIDAMQELRQGIGLQAYGQRDPLVEYKMNGYEMFDEMTQNIKEETVRLLFHIKIEQKVEREQVAQVTGTNKDVSLAKAPTKRAAAKVYPNDPCPCGSGKKYKQCCGRAGK